MTKPGYKRNPEIFFFPKALLYPCYTVVAFSKKKYLKSTFVILIWDLFNFYLILIGNCLIYKLYIVSLKTNWLFKPFVKIYKGIEKIIPMKCKISWTLSENERKALLGIVFSLLRCKYGWAWMQFFNAFSSLLCLPQ